jgi:hypothetical protein
MVGRSLGFWTLSIVWNSKQLENTKFRKLELFPSSGEGRDTPTLLGHLERANMKSLFLVQNKWVSGLCPSTGILNTRKHNVSETGSVSVHRPPPYPRTESDQVSETLCFIVYRMPDCSHSPETQ